MSWKRKLFGLFSTLSRESTQEQNTCSLCGNLFDNETDLKTDCGGGHCWECLSEVEAEGMGFDVEYYRTHHDEIWSDMAKEHEN